ncbi:MAG: hypothetical protein L3J43_09820 [Sulfurovum sp.]|nr:hypothetical protein [Sulfurovum sp.]
MGRRESIPVYGEMEIDGQFYDILSWLVDDKTSEKINTYRKQNRADTSVWIKYTCKCRIIDNKLYLHEITLTGAHKNIIPELFNTDKLFAQWQNKDIKLGARLV